MLEVFDVNKMVGGMSELFEWLFGELVCFEIVLVVGFWWVKVDLV